MKNHPCSLETWLSIIQQDHRQMSLLFGLKLYCAEHYFQLLKIGCLSSVGVASLIAIVIMALSCARGGLKPISAGFLISISLIALLLGFTGWFGFQVVINNDGFVKSFFDTRKMTAFTLSNGLRVLHVQNPAGKRFKLSVSVGAGAFHDPEDSQGLAHLTEHMVFSQSGNQEDGLYKFVLDHEGSVNGHTYSDTTSFFVDLKEKDSQICEKAIAKMGQALSTIKLSDDLVKAEQIVIDEEYEKEKSNVFYRLTSVANTLFKRHPIQQLGVGSIASFKNKDQLFARVKEFYSTHYTADNMAIYMESGSFDADRSKELLESAFKGIQKSVNGRSTDIAVPVIDPAKKEVYVKIHEPSSVPTAAFLFTVPKANEHKHWLPADFMQLVINHPEGLQKYLVKEEKVALKVTGSVVEDNVAFYQFAILVSLHADMIQGFQYEVVFDRVQKYLRKLRTEPTITFLYKQFCTLQKASFYFDNASLEGSISEMSRRVLKSDCLKRLYVDEHVPIFDDDKEKMGKIIQAYIKRYFSDPIMGVYGDFSAESTAVWEEEPKHKARYLPIRHDAHPPLPFKEPKDVSFKKDFVASLEESSEISSSTCSPVEEQVKAITVKKSNVQLYHRCVSHQGEKQVSVTVLLRSGNARPKTQCGVSEIVTSLLAQQSALQDFKADNVHIVYSQRRDYLRITLTGPPQSIKAALNEQFEFVKKAVEGDQTSLKDAYYEAKSESKDYLTEHYSALTNMALQSELGECTPQDVEKAFQLGADTLLPLVTSYLQTLKQDLASGKVQVSALVIGNMGEKEAVSLFEDINCNQVVDAMKPLVVKENSGQKTIEYGPALYSRSSAALLEFDIPLSGEKDVQKQLVIKRVAVRIMTSILNQALSRHMRNDNGWSYLAGAQRLDSNGAVRLRLFAESSKLSPIQLAAVMKHYLRGFDMAASIGDDANFVYRRDATLSAMRSDFENLAEEQRYMLPRFLDGTHDYDFLQANGFDGDKDLGREKFLRIFSDLKSSEPKLQVFGWGRYIGAEKLDSLDELKNSEERFKLAFAPVTMKTNHGDCVNTELVQVVV